MQGDALSGGRRIGTTSDPRSPLSDRRYFVGVAESLAALKEFAHVTVVSATPTAALRAEWTDARLLGHVDDPGDHAAAEANDVLFFPIVPGREEASWRELLSELLSAFYATNPP